MIVDFTVKNFLSIKEELTFSFLSNNKKNKEQLNVAEIDSGKYSLHVFSGIYGPNASGKSNIVNALMDFKKLILMSNKLGLEESIPVYKPFKFDMQSIVSPVSFEIEFVADKTRYLYEVEFVEKEILKEILFCYPNKRKALIFSRVKGDKIKYGTYFKGEKRILEIILLKNQLLVSVGANSNNKFLSQIYKFFRDMLIIHSRMDSSPSGFKPLYTTRMLDQKGDEFKDVLLTVLRSADINLEDVKLEENKSIASQINFPDDVPDNIRRNVIREIANKPILGHTVFDHQQKIGDLSYLDLLREESTGTVKMYDLAGKIWDALRGGKVLVIDEFNSGLHPLLTMFIINIFMNDRINRNHSQLLITTHDVSVLDMSVLKREQIWFTDKDRFGSTELYSMEEFESDKNLLRDYSRYGKYYLDGRFKAVPALDMSLLEDIFTDA